MYVGKIFPHPPPPENLGWSVACVRYEIALIFFSKRNIIHISSNLSSYPDLKMEVVCITCVMSKISVSEKTLEKTMDDTDLLKTIKSCCDSKTNREHPKPNMIMSIVTGDSRCLVRLL